MSKFSAQHMAGRPILWKRHKNANAASDFRESKLPAKLTIKAADRASNQANCARGAHFPVRCGGQVLSDISRVDGKEKKVLQNLIKT